MAGTQNDPRKGFGSVFGTIKKDVGDWIERNKLRSADDPYQPPGKPVQKASAPSPKSTLDPASNLDGSTPASRSVPLPKSAVGKPGYDARAKIVAPALTPKPAAPRSKTDAAMAAVRADKGLMDTIKSDATALKNTLAKPSAAPVPKKSWWDKFSDDHALSANKSYADYRKLMGD